MIYVRCQGLTRYEKKIEEIVNSEKIIRKEQVLKPMEYDFLFTYDYDDYVKTGQISPLYVHHMYNPVGLFLEMYRYNQYLLPTSNTVGEIKKGEGEYLHAISPNSRVALIDKNTIYFGEFMINNGTALIFPESISYIEDKLVTDHAVYVMEKKQDAEIEYIFHKVKLLYMHNSTSAGIIFSEPDYDEKTMESVHQYKNNEELYNHIMKTEKNIYYLETSDRKRLITQDANAKFYNDSVIKLYNEIYQKFTTDKQKTNIKKIPVIYNQKLHQLFVESVRYSDDSKLQIKNHEDIDLNNDNVVDINQTIAVDFWKGIVDQVQNSLEIKIKDLAGKISKTTKENLYDDPVFYLGKMFKYFVKLMYILRKDNILDFSGVDLYQVMFGGNPPDNLSDLFEYLIMWATLRRLTLTCGHFSICAITPSRKYKSVKHIIKIATRRSINSFDIINHFLGRYSINNVVKCNINSFRIQLANSFTSHYYMMRDIKIDDPNGSNGDRKEKSKSGIKPSVGGLIENHSLFGTQNTTYFIIIIMTLAILIYVCNFISEIREKNDIEFIKTDNDYTNNLTYLNPGILHL